MTDDPINHPLHYCRGGIEAVDVIEAWELDYHIGNAIKYLCRAGYKTDNKTTTDLQKAIWFINRKIEMLEKTKNG